MSNFSDAIPLIQAYSHGDCDRPRPLWGALESGFCNVEADIWLCDGQLLVAHDFENVFTKRTLLNTYLEPLAQLARANGGYILEDGVEFTLLVDIKNEPTATYHTLKRILEPYRDILSTYEDGVVTKRSVTILLSGERPTEEMKADASRVMFLDGRIADFTKRTDPRLTFWISDNWETQFEWRGRDELPEPDRKRLAVLVTKCHEEEMKLRLWSAPDTPTGWQTLLDMGVDLISTDRIEPLAKFLKLRIELARQQ